MGRGRNRWIRWQWHIIGFQASLPLSSPQSYTIVAYVWGATLPFVTYVEETITICAAYKEVRRNISTYFLQVPPPLFKMKHMLFSVHSLALVGDRIGALSSAQTRWRFFG